MSYTPPQISDEDWERLAERRAALEKFSKRRRRGTTRLPFAKPRWMDDAR